MVEQSAQHRTGVGAGVKQLDQPTDRMESWQATDWHAED